MKLLNVNTYDIHGGAARAAYRLHRALLDANIDSQMLVKTKSSDDDTVIGVPTAMQKVLSPIQRRLDAFALRPYKNRRQAFFSPAVVPYSGVAQRINALNPDIVHLHWICGGMMSVEELAKIKAPIVWSLHDNWAFTGGCHVKWECEKYRHGCGACPALGSKEENDLSRRIFKRKLRAFSRIKRLTVVGLSEWMADCAAKSELFRTRTIRKIPNPLDTEIYAPVPKKEARALLRLPSDKKIIIFGALHATTDLCKGFAELGEALNHIQTEKTEFLVFGSNAPKERPKFKFKAHYFGRLHDDIALRLLYSAADVMVVPSLQEAFGQTAVESMACGTPVVAFGHTGLLDIVDHKINGFLAKPFDTLDLAKGIDWILGCENHDQLRAAAREKVVTTFDSKIVARQYIDLYRTILA
jgi:glycosyltransferase involved in cell wall biosynthesis